MTTTDAYVNRPDSDHDLFFELDAFNPRWQSVYGTLREASEAASALPLYYDYMASNEGWQRKLTFTDVPDTVSRNKAERALRERMAHYGKRLGSEGFRSFSGADFDDE